MNLPFTPDLSGKVAAVTGGGGILCSQMAIALAQCGAKVAVMDRAVESGKKIADEIAAAGGTAIAVGCDITDKANMTGACEIVENELGPVDILINGAGGNHPKGTAAKEM